MENLSREAILRMLSGKTGNSSSSGGGGEIDLAGYATSIWVTENFVSIDFFRELFRAFDSNSNEILPNDTTSVVASIKAMVGTWTEQYLTALGNASGGGGGTGGAQYLNDLLDVELTTPLTTGQALIYNATLQKWVNGDAGVNMTTVWNALAGSTNEQINASHLTSVLSGYATTSAISDMATQTWVGQQGFATQTWVTSNFITIAYFDRLFRAYNGSTLVSHNDTTTTIDNIKAMLGFWTEFYLSALGTGGVSSVSISLSQLADVNVTGVTNGQVLSYNSTNAEWVPITISNVTSLSALTDVALSSPTTYQVLMYDASSTKWYNSALKTINGQPLYGSGDISVGGGASGNYLPLSGGTLTGSSNNLLSLDTSNSLGPYIYFKINGTAKGSVAYYAGMASIANDTNNYGYRIGVLDNGSPVYRMGPGSTSTTYTLLHEGNWSYYVNPYVSNIAPGYSITTTDWSYIRFTSGNELWDIGTHQSAGGNTNGGLGIRQDGAYFNGLYIQRNTSSYGKLQILVPSGECSLSFLSGSSGITNKWTIGYTGSNEEFGWYYSVGGGWKMTLDSSGKLSCGSVYATGAVTALSDIRHKTVIKDAAVSVEDIARMPAVMYQWNDGREDKELHVGSIAQSWQSVLPEVVLKANDEEGTLSMQYGVAALVSAIIIARKVVNHEERIKQLEKENKELKERLKIA